MASGAAPPDELCCCGKTAEATDAARHSEAESEEHQAHEGPRRPARPHCGGRARGARRTRDCELRQALDLRRRYGGERGRARPGQPAA